MALFEPPTVADVPRVLPDTTGPGYWLFRHFSPLLRGRSVLKAHDGTYTTVDTPTGDQIDAASVAYIGGHIYEISDDEAAALTAAGYGAGVSAGLPAVGSVRLVDGFKVDVNGEYRIANIPAVSAPSGDGLINEYDFSADTGGADGNVGFYIGNDADGDPARFAVDQVIDSADLPGWVTFIGTDNNTSVSGNAGGPNAETWDGTWTQFDLGFEFTVDAGSDPDWTERIPTPSIASVSPAHAHVGDTVIVTGVGFSVVGAPGAIVDCEFSNTPTGYISPTYTIDSDTQITATVPVGAITGHIKVTSPGGGLDTIVFTVDP